MVYKLESITFTIKNMNLIKTKEENLISARDIFIDLGIKRDFSNWIKYSLDKAMLEEGKDFTTILAKSTGGRPSIEYYLKRDAAISIAIVSGGKNAKKVRGKLPTHAKRWDGL